MTSRYTFKQRLMLAIIPRIAASLALLLGRTLRYRDVSEPGALVMYEIPAPAVYAFWHRCILAGAWRFHGHRIHILISRSFDGELIARTAEHMGFVAVRGSSSRDGAPGLRNLQRAYTDGNYCAITADGPRGPIYVAKPGVAQLASLVGTHLAACHVHAHNAWQLRSWDRFMIPKPFSRVTIAWTRNVSADLSEIQSALDRAVALAEQDTE